ncbi:MAG TPA: alpha/beta hydrolase [Caulobacteraceae bacterium]|nr:alpha/beta hydrolase [Caulobacteraceae bacterium]
MKRLLIALAASFSAGMACAAEPPVDPARDVYLHPQTLATLPDGRHLNFFCEGEGSPTVLVSPGWHIPDIGWRTLQAEMAKTTRVCIVNRAGYGFSDPGPMPRDTAAEVKDMHDGLQAARIPGPYVLVGHSLGGFDIRLFAYEHPEETAGLLLLDPPTEHIFQHTRTPDEDVDLMQRCAALARKETLVPHGKDGCIETALGPGWSQAMHDRYAADERRPEWFETLRSEDISMVGRSADEMVAARRKLGSIPLVVLQADEDCGPKGDTFDRARCAELLSQARDSTRGERRIVAGASHMIQVDKPDVFLATFREVVAQARASGLATAAKPR